MGVDPRDYSTLNRTCRDTEKAPTQFWAGASSAPCGAGIPGGKASYCAVPPRMPVRLSVIGHHLLFATTIVACRSRFVKAIDESVEQRALPSPVAPFRERKGARMGLQGPGGAQSAPPGPRNPSNSRPQWSGGWVGWGQVPFVNTLVDDEGVERPQQPHQHPPQTSGAGWGGGRDRFSTPSWSRVLGRPLPALDGAQGHGDRFHATAAGTRR